MGTSASIKFKHLEGGSTIIRTHWDSYPEGMANKLQSALTYIDECKEDYRRPKLISAFIGAKDNINDIAFIDYNGEGEDYSYTIDTQENITCRSYIFATNKYIIVFSGSITEFIETYKRIKA